MFPDSIRLAILLTAIEALSTGIRSILAFFSKSFDSSIVCGFRLRYVTTTFAVFVGIAIIAVGSLPLA